jgi:hypothetical protein
MGPKAASNKASTTSKALPKIAAKSTNPSSNALPGAASAKGGGGNKLPAITNSPPKKSAEEIEKEKAEAEKRAAEEAEAARAKVEEEEKEKARVEAEEAERKLKGNGNVKLIYERYDEEFAIVEGSCTAAEIDDVYCLSFVMPNCLIHLSLYSPQDKRVMESEILEKSEYIERLQAELEGKVADKEGSGDTEGEVVTIEVTEERKEEIKSELGACWEVVKQELYIKEEPVGTFHGLEKDVTYYVYVEQEADQLARDQEKMRMIAMEMEGCVGSSRRTDFGDHGDTCTCIYGTPCIDEEGCRNWKQRFLISESNGWIKQAMVDDLQKGIKPRMF